MAQPHVPANLQPTIQPTSSLHQLRVNPERLRELSLRRPCFIAVFLRVEIQRRPNLRVTQDALHGLGFEPVLSQSSDVPGD
jgi:hypothetical protein